jgi:hypothetical protein
MGYPPITPQPSEAKSRLNENRNLQRNNINKRLPNLLEWFRLVEPDVCAGRQYLRVNSRVYAPHFNFAVVQRRKTKSPAPMTGTRLFVALGHAIRKCLRVCHQSRSGEGREGSKVVRRPDQFPEM